MTRSLYEIGNQVLPKQKYRLTLQHPDKQPVEWIGAFATVAQESALYVVRNMESDNFIVDGLKAIFIPEKRHLLKLEQQTDRVGIYDSNISKVTERDIETARRLFFERIPAQAYLLLATNLVSPRKIGLTLRDTEIAVISDVEPTPVYFKRTT